MDASLTWKKDVVVDDGLIGPDGLCDRIHWESNCHRNPK